MFLYLLCNCLTSQSLSLQCTEDSCESHSLAAFGGLTYDKITSLHTGSLPSFLHQASLHELDQLEKLNDF